MSLLDDLKEWYTSESYPPEGEEVDAELVSHEDLAELRWGTQFQNVYKRGSEYIAVNDVRPATEMQDWGDYGKPDFYPVEPVEVTVTKYRKVS